MFGDAAREAVIQNIVKQIELELGGYHETDEAAKALKRIGRFALTQFDWTSPDWAEDYEKVFRSYK